ncbi:MAG: glycosyltransferase family 9 protein [Bacteroidetes bacterium]|nr:MAG: glycosyltransferase family 9 protein [Bacteroidota bacterium]REK08036.1 MAG: glycosyltransferase family 9 protein [Bacteroidota bacterium]REK32241.1 MAG: glycosyltransferase family 9 protein [Bacteroidota bacterium]REK47393.1 MAG: glycosyltransferase family 9 protein [Bacteroidota bacterium]
MQQKFLIIQTAFPGDVILSTSVAETLHRNFPDAEIHYLVRSGNESLFKGHPFINKIIIWEKRKSKYKSLLSVIRQVRKEHYSHAFNLQRFFSSGLITALSGAKFTSGFDKNPLSFLFDSKSKHSVSDGLHEIERNHHLVSKLTGGVADKPRLYPGIKDYEKIALYIQTTFICIAPGSVWFTKTFPKEKWALLIEQLFSKHKGIKIYLLGSASESQLCDELVRLSASDSLINLSGQLSMLESAALMKGAQMNFVNDSAPMHLASAVNANVTAIYCSTIPGFGFGPLSDCSKIVETKEILSCRPCGLHGYRSCPEGHFKCALTIDVDSIIS